MYINDSDTQKILERSADDLCGVISEFSPLKKSGSDFLTMCPKCGSDNGLSINPAKHVFKCFKCGEVKGRRPVDYLMTGQGMSYPDALKWLAEHYGILLEEKAPRRPRRDDEKPERFVDTMLRGSGLTAEDVTASCVKSDDNSCQFLSRTFQAGTVNEKGEPVKEGNDCLIYYYDLEGREVMYQHVDHRGKPVGDEVPYFRVRWQFPEEHKDKDGRAMKYRSPYGSQTQLYIPQRLRALYRAGLEIPRLYIQEGEKKAEKASKHGLPSIGIAGIQNFGINGQLPETIVQVVERCKVREICFILDGDCFDLTSNIKIDDPIQKRPEGFFYAVKNFKEYCNSLKNRGFDLEIWFGYVLKNDAGDKGVDDLLADTLKGREDELAKDVETAVNTKNGSGRYVQMHKITTVTDSKIADIWNLTSPAKFCERYKDKLKDLPYFTFRKYQYRYNENGELESAQPVAPEEQFWDTEEVRGRKEYVYRYERGLTFLYNRGFGKYRMGDARIYVRLDSKIVSVVTVDDIRDFVMEFTRSFLKEAVLEMLHKGLPMYLGDFKLSSLRYQSLAFEKPARNTEHMYFSNCFWTITPESIVEMKYEQLHYYIWDEQRKPFAPRILPDLIRVTRSEVGYNYTVTPEGEKCQFLKFLVNASNFTWRKEAMRREGKTVEILPVEYEENRQHLVAKLCAIGYLISGMKDRAVAKAVVAVDGNQSEVGTSNGRTGKSLMGELMKMAVSTAYINGKIADPAHDSFIWTEVQEKTRLVFIDDVKQNFDFEMLFADITGDWAVNYKGGSRATFPFERSPKLFLTTNHMIAGEGKSFADRQWSVAFSDWYNDEHKPIDDFGCIFFSEWDQEQWNLTWNLLAQCICLFFRFGVVESPQERIDQRRLRQFVGEEFILWADEYYSDDDHRNVRLRRSDLYDALLKFVGMAHREKFYTPQRFRDKLVGYCKYKGYIFNPHRFESDGTPLRLKGDGTPDIYDKVHGIEYFMVGDPDYYTQPQKEMPSELLISGLTTDGDGDDQAF